MDTDRKRKRKEEYLYSAIYSTHTLKALRHGSRSFTCKLHHACLSTPLDRTSCCLQGRLMCAKKHIIVPGAHWCPLANTIEPSVCGGQEWAVQKLLNLLRCHLGGGTLLWSQQTIYWTRVHIDASWVWVLPMNDLSTAPMDGQCKNGWTDWDAIYRVDSHGVKEQCISWVSTLAQPGEYNWTSAIPTNMQQHIQVHLHIHMQ